LFFSLSGLFGCAQKDEASTADEGYVAMTITCQTAYRSSDTVPIEQQTSVVLNDTNKDQEVRYADLVFHAHYNGGRASYESRSLTVWVSTTEAKNSLHHTLYQMRKDQRAANQFGDHGFTGLVYTHSPTSQAELQHWCSAK
jgi:hypothetical protein